MIRITKNGMYVDSYSAEGTLTQTRPVPDDEPIGGYLDDLIDVEEGVTVEDLLLMLSGKSAEIDADFSVALNGVPFDAVLAELVTSKIEPCEHYGSIEVMHTAQIISGTWTEVTTAVANGFMPDDPERKATAFTLEFAPLASYKHLPIVLNNEFQILSESKELLVSAYRDFSLYELIFAIIYEITLYGGPNDRMAALVEYVGWSDEEGDDQDLGSLQRSLDEAVVNEDYEQATKLRDLINQKTEQNKTNK